MLDYADLLAINKFDKRGAADALRDVKKQYAYSRRLASDPDRELPVFGTRASQIGDQGVDRLYDALLEKLAPLSDAEPKPGPASGPTIQERAPIIPPARSGYLAEISQTVRGYNRWAAEQSDTAQRLYGQQTACRAIALSGLRECHAQTFLDGESPLPGRP